MDPDVTLAELRELTAVMLAAEDSPEAALESSDRFAELVVALDEWLSRGGHLPADWQPKTDAVTDKQVLDRLAWLLSAEEWPGASGMEDVAELVQLTGRDITDNPDVDWPRH